MNYSPLNTLLRCFHFVCGVRNANICVRMCWIRRQFSDQKKFMKEKILEDL